MSERQNCIFVLIRESVTFAHEYPEYVATYTDAAEVTKVTRAHNESEKWFAESEGHPNNNRYRYFVRNVWL